MKQEKGTLKTTKKTILVTLPTKNGTADFPIPEAARRFRSEDAADGVDVDVERDRQNRIVKVTIPGAQEVAAPPTRKRSERTPRRQTPRTRTGDRSRHKSGEPKAVRGVPKAAPAILGLSFHNPYTFLPFPEKEPSRNRPTPLSIDELQEERGRLTGTLDLEITTQTPLLTCNPKPVKEENGHKTYEAFRIGPDVIVPATGIRGALRTLLTILTGGTLGYLNQHAYLCQGRDANLGPRGARSPEGTPKHVFLAEVIRAGTALRSGEVRLGQTRLIRLDALERCYKKRLPRGPRPAKLWVGLDAEGQPHAVGETPSSKTPWKLKLSGRPINLKGKREGLFLPGEKTVTLPADVWAAYSGRNPHGDRPELKAGDLIWLEPKDPEAERIEGAKDVKSIQWARWGRAGQALKDIISEHSPQVLPDNLRDDGLVDEVTDLFGQVPERGAVEASHFAARIRPENLVFFNAASNTERVTLAPLAPPHPGCIAFYRRNGDPDDVCERDALSGYKTYRTTKERGASAPWQFKVQGVYGKKGELLREQQKVNKTCDLVSEETTGTVRIAFRSLTKRELALLIQACTVPWRLGGGKPLGLGLCRVRIKRLLDEYGHLMKVPDWTIRESENSLSIEGWENEVSDLRGRVRMWEASQRPVEKLRYPRAVDANRFGKSRGGHAWFQRHASPRMVKGKGDSGREAGLEPLYVDGPLKEAAKQPLDVDAPMIAGQLLPPFDPEDPLADLLYGYDGFGAQTEERQRKRIFLKLEEFDPSKHVTGSERSEGSHGRDGEFRRKQRKGRRTEGQ